MRRTGYRGILLSLVVFSSASLFAGAPESANPASTQKPSQAVALQRRSTPAPAAQPGTQAANAVLAGLDSKLVWQRTSPSLKKLDGPVLYQLLFSTAGTPGTLAKFDTNPRHLTNSMLVETANGITVGGASTFAIGSNGIITFAAGQTFPGTMGGGVQISPGAGVLTNPTPITGAGTISLDTTFTDGRYLQLKGGTISGALNVNAPVGINGAVTVAGAMMATSFNGDGSALMNVNATNFGGQPASAFPRISGGNNLTGNQTVTNDHTLLPTGCASPVAGVGCVAVSTGGFNSGGYEQTAAAFNSTSSASQTQKFRWEADVVNNNSATPSAQLSLSFGSPTVPSGKILSVDATGKIGFAPGQTFPGALALSGGTMTGNITFGPGQTFPGAGSGSFLPLAGGTMAGNILFTSGNIQLTTPPAQFQPLPSGSISAFGGVFVGSGGGVVGEDTSAGGIGVQGLAPGNSGAVGVIGNSTATSGTTDGVIGFDNSAGGEGVRGVNLATTGGTGVIGVYGNNLNGTPNPAATGGMGVHGFNSTTTGTGVRGDAGATSGFNFGVAGATASTGGIGTDGFASATTGSSATGTRGLSAGDSGIGVSGLATNTTGNTIGVQGVDFSPTGNGVVGQANSSAPGATANGVFAKTAAPNGSGVSAMATDATVSGAANGVSATTASPNGIAVLGTATDTTAVVVGTTPNQGTIGVEGVSQSLAGTAVQALAPAQCLLPACDPTLAGAPAPTGLFARVLHANGIAIVAQAGSRTVGCALPSCDPTKTGNIGVLARSFHPNGVGVYGIATDASVTTNATGEFSVGVIGQAKSPTSYALYANFIPATVDVGAAALINNQAGVTASPPATRCKGATACTILELQANGTREFHFDGAGNAHAAGTFQAGGADVAESVAVRGERALYEPGDVMVIDAEGKRTLAKSQSAYSTLVAGIVSTKPGLLASRHNTTNPAEQTAMAGEVPLAIVGIVPCKVSAEGGSIRPGDLLVSSSTPGHAMKGTDRARMLGAVVGKAMQPLETGTGVIEVLVTLQ